MRTGLPSGTVTFLFTDIAGSTRLLKDVGPEAYARELAEHRRILRAAFEEHGGVEVDTQGDAFFVAFGTATGAVAAAGAGQRALHAGPIVVRMGLHTGAPSVTADGYVGIDVHRGARIAALAHGGQVLLSASTVALLEDEPLLDLGLHRLKDFDAPAQLFQLGAEQFPPVRTPGAVDLPTPVTPFLGRQRELFAAAALWLDRSPRVLTIVGPGGTGKTRFAIELARFLAEEAGGGSVFVPLAPVRDPALVVPLIAERVGASGDSAGAIATRLGERRTHVVLDNLEQLLPDAAQPLSELLSVAPSLHILATSREPLHVSGESEFDLQPMDEADALALFLERAQAIRPEIADAAPVHELINRLDRLPLAIELAAARVKLLGPEQLLERIGQRLDLLKGGRDADVRHATLRATIAWSYDLLAEDEQLLFARLAIFRGGSTLEDAERICDADLDALGSLLDKSLLRRRTEPDGTDRFWMLETIGEFARERLAATGEEATLRRRQADELIALADRAGTRAVIERPQRWDVDAIAPEIDNVRAVLEWAAVVDPERGLYLAAWLEAYWVVREPVEGMRWLELFVERAPDADPIMRAHAMRALGGVHDIFGQSPEAAPWYVRSLELFVEARSEPQAAHGRFRIAANMLMRGQAEGAWPLLEESLQEARRLEMPLGESQALGFLAGRAQQSGDLTRGIELALESAAIAHDVGWIWWEAGQLQNAAVLERERGNLDAADTHATRSLELSLALGDRQHVVFAAAELAIVASLRDDARRAGRLWGALETEVGTGRIGLWERNREELEALVQVSDVDAYNQGYADGSLLTVEQAAAVR